MKILEAMAAGKAIVSTAIGCEGLEVEPGRDLIVADEPEAFARAIVRLIREPSLRRSLGEAARKRALERYDWRPIAARLVAFYRTLGEASTTARGGR
ncbi:MAG: hypothetical protein KatS3mg115_2626 [Candidatus Poribacteria bacterium]|nr:MAG: hypothetical protein KatS3mg115_2626 [Candidatus Poribacteria bacterium]